MPRKLRILSGKEVIKILEKHGFLLKRTLGSHARLSLITKEKETFHITIPLHVELKKGTIKGIVSELEKYVSVDDFYTK
mgnify:CR=1 FL=1